ncbi:dihydrolipoamide acetyltransferase family protein [Algoriphagus halophytocola]|uniref:Dihydrolipoamide acetyltransferase component of pyruvate dehydrogenase complex n=1 Tax=Algoriphagus halophytocola TaxID=2991499 RepID=A0ABY6ML14_9BACT|nr:MULTISPECIES: dihydrolipoamide acetyltransferase family protein [unclassified Algoriphagus]UZD23654.1 2-oxo acid dehydrogenase subunit E2 [Algoriphagus sp. TR-M5]WBL44947.1 dihydrolipoamide acetyltransferase family protein [Algoriphagus sp. TR-M9]
MAIVEMLMPKMGESIIEGTVLAWLKHEGDTIEQDESVLEVATDKVDTEVPSTHGGILKQILAKEGDVIAVGAPIALIETSDKVEEAVEEIKPEDPKAELMDLAPENTAALINPPENQPQKPEDDRFYSPLVQSIAKEEGISASELAKIAGTGKDGRVTKQDMLTYVASKNAKKPVEESQPSISAPISATSISGTDEIIEMDRMRKMIASRMIESKRISAHVTSFVEADMTNIVLWRERNKLDYKAKFGESITYTPFFIEAVAKAIRDFPMINISVDGDRIIVKKDINVGMAVALPSGNLIVPIIKNADQLNIVGIAKKVNELANRARNNKLTADDLAGGTYTVSNVGSFGNVMGTPIIPQPQVAILAVGAIVKKPAVIETPTGDVIGIRHKMFLSHSYDHRVVDGSLGGKFVKRVADYLEAFNINTSL